HLTVKLITCRGVVVHPLSDKAIMPDLVDVLQCRIVPAHADILVDDALVLQALQCVQGHYQWGHIEKLHRFDDVTAYSKSHGES
ncbi:MAG: isocitrate dehydrogenase, partial [Alphaproteobacteria bacterium]|nr:isocitrate dehydrogenase [Alphaproteobacteria bacterium]